MNRPIESVFLALGLPLISALLPLTAQSQVASQQAGKDNVRLDTVSLNAPLTTLGEIKSDANSIIDLRKALPRLFQSYCSNVYIDRMSAITDPDQAKDGSKGSNARQPVTFSINATIANHGKVGTVAGAIMDWGGSIPFAYQGHGLNKTNLISISCGFLIGGGTAAGGTDVQGSVGFALGPRLSFGTNRVLSVFVAPYFPAISNGGSYSISPLIGLSAVGHF